METIKRILAPTDLSELSRVGVRYALNLAKAVGAEVTVYHVVDSNEIARYGEKIRRGLGDYQFSPGAPILDQYQLALSQFLKGNFSDLIPSVKINEKVEMGNPDGNIVEEAKKEAADLIVISTHGRTGLSHMLLGSVTEKVVRTAPCPVLSIRPGEGQKAAKKAAAA